MSASTTPIATRESNPRTTPAGLSSNCVVLTQYNIARIGIVSIQGKTGRIWDESVQNRDRWLAGGSVPGRSGAKGKSYLWHFFSVAFPLPPTLLHAPTPFPHAPFTPIHTPTPLLLHHAPRSTLPHHASSPLPPRSFYTPSFIPLTTTLLLLFSYSLFATTCLLHSCQVLSILSLRLFFLNISFLPTMLYCVLLDFFLILIRLIFFFTFALRLIFFFTFTLFIFPIHF
jgi:hypothetical protein